MKDYDKVNLILKLFKDGKTIEEVEAETGFSNSYIRTIATDYPLWCGLRRKYKPSL